MMISDKTRNGIIVVSIILAAAFVIYKKFLDPIVIVAKNKYKNFPNKSYQAHLEDVKSFYKDNPQYVKNWAKAVRFGTPTFTFNGVTYETETGRIKS